MRKCDQWKAIRICSWVARFIWNSRTKQQRRITRPITTEETTKRLQFWVRRTQFRYQTTSKFEEDKLRLNLQKNAEGLFECRGCIQGDYPIYLPDDAVFTEKLVMHAHFQTLHGGVGMTMTNVRERYWGRCLTRMTKWVICSCYGCRRYQVTALANPPMGSLPKERTKGSVPFKFVGVDFAGPVKCLNKSKGEMKAYIVLYACCLTRAVYLEVLPNLSVEEFIRSLKRLIARRGHPEKIFSDNGKTFVAAAKWLRNIRNDEKLNNVLAKQGITWQFNLSRTPWWGGQYERLIGIMKQSLYKSIGHSFLRWHELEEVIINVEIALNNRPLGYVEDNVQMPVLTPSIMLWGQPNQLPDEETDAIEDANLRERAKYLRRCKGVLWSRWTTEYLKALKRAPQSQLQNERSNTNRRRCCSDQERGT